MHGHTTVLTRTYSNRISKIMIGFSRQFYTPLSRGAGVFPSASKPASHFNLFRALLLFFSFEALLQSFVSL